MPRFTRTYVRYFGDGELETLFSEQARLRLLFESRRPAIGRLSQRALERRLELLGAAIHLLAEPVPEAFE